MKITKRQLKRIIKEEKQKLIREQGVIPPREEHVDTYYDDDAYGHGGDEETAEETILMNVEVEIDNLIQYINEETEDIEGGASIRRSAFYLALEKIHQARS